MRAIYPIPGAGRSCRRLFAKILAQFSVPEIAPRRRLTN